MTAEEQRAQQLTQLGIATVHTLHPGDALQLAFAQLAVLASMQAKPGEHLPDDAAKIRDAAQAACTAIRGTLDKVIVVPRGGLRSIPSVG